MRRDIAFNAACLHIATPAGLFLSAPYGESTFALFNFLGMLCYVYATQCHTFGSKSATGACWTLAAGASFGIATTMRNNGLLSGMIFAWDAIEAIVCLPSMLRDTIRITHFAATIIAGICVAIGFVAPQAVAYTQYCTGGNTRPWCNRLLPSIYSWVQDHYWEVGFMRYWTLTNLPLFLLAGPLLAILFYTGYLALLKLASLVPQGRSQSGRKLAISDTQIFRHVLPRFALPQLVLAVMAATSFHVQIINRISSGYPVWYILLAIAMHNTSSTINTQKSNNSTKRVSDAAGRVGSWSLLVKSQHLQWIVRGMVAYAIVQGGLYASFLPPA